MTLADTIAHLNADEAAERLWLAEAELLAGDCDPATWLAVMFPAYTTEPLAKYHETIWEWAWRLALGVPTDPLVVILTRDGAKSTTAELACVRIAAHASRRYGLYVCETQDQADDHVKNIADMLEAPTVARHYPRLGERALGKYGHSKAWRRNRLWTASGFVLDAIGLDTAARGVKIDDTRPDLFIIDELDGEEDSAATTRKKIRALTRKILPAGTDDVAVLAVQNLVSADGIFGRLAGVANEPADFLARRTVSGPHPAVEDLTTQRRPDPDHPGQHRDVIVGGRPTWRSLDFWQERLDNVGLSAFLAEFQHDVSTPAGGLFDHVEFVRVDWSPGLLERMVRVVVWCDPAVTSTDDSDSHAVQCDGVDEAGTVYRFFSWEQRATPVEALRKAILTALQYGADVVGVETDQGGDTWESVYREAWQSLVDDGLIEPGEECPPFSDVKASQTDVETGRSHGSKVQRANRMLVDYETPKHGGVVHVIGTHLVLERALRRFPRTKPYDLVDAAGWAWHDLRHPKPRRRLTMRAVA